MADIVLPPTHRQVSEDRQIEVGVRPQSCKLLTTESWPGLFI